MIQYAIWQGENVAHFFDILDHWIKDGSKQVDRGYTKIDI